MINNTVILQKIKLIDFQAHPHLEIEFVDGVNVIHGRTDAGKSCLRRSIEFLCQHATFKGQRRVGTKLTSVKGWFSNEVVVERIISNSINRYIITKDGEEKIFDSVGRSAPEEVKQVIGIYPISIDGEEIYLNSYIQIGKPFLFDQSPSTRAKLFNKLTGNDVLDKLFGEFNKDILRIKRNKKDEEEQFENRKDILKSKKVEMEKADVIHSLLKKKIQNIRELYEKYSKLLELKELGEINKENQEAVAKILKTLKFPQTIVIQQLKEKINRFDILLTHKNNAEKNEIALNSVQRQLKDYKPLNVNIEGLRGKIERFSNIKGIYEKFSQNQVLLCDFRKKLKIIDMDLKCDHKELDKYEVCTECDGRGVKFNE